VNSSDGTLKQAIQQLQEAASFFDSAPGTAGEVFQVNHIRPLDGIA
jgi:hypothetical protein